MDLAALVLPRLLQLVFSLINWSLVLTGDLAVTAVCLRSAATSLPQTATRILHCLKHIVFCSV